MNTRNTAKLDNQPTRRAVSVAGTILGTGFFILAATMSFLLVLEHISGWSLPGCGAESACEQATQSFWGKVQLGDFEWPVSFLGLAYFSAAAVTWLIVRGQPAALVRNIVRLGALGSLFFGVIIVVKWLFCPYCIGAHLGNFAGWATMELTGRRGSGRHAGAGLASFIGVFVLSSVGVGVWDAQVRGAAQEKAEGERSQAVQQMIERAADPTNDPEPPQETSGTPDPDADETTAAASVDDPDSGDVTEPNDIVSESASTVDGQTEPPGEGADSAGFTGRYRYGPVDAPIRIVMYTAYQCPDCRRLEHQVERLIATRDDISVSIKHFPFTAECNPFISRTTQPNGCWAARAAEAAGMIWGTEGFWKMHRWLFAQRGSFTQLEDLRPAFLDPQLDMNQFRRVLLSEETIERVRADCREAKRYGLFFTPMIFVNGVELKGWNAPNALIRTVTELAAANPPRRMPTADQPPLALQKYVEDWQDEPVRNLPPDRVAHTLGREDAAIQIVLWGDYQEPGTAMADAAARQFASGRADVAYTFRHYPFNSDCNPNLPYPRHVLACWAAHAAEAAGALGGEEAYWKMHAWLMDNQLTPLAPVAARSGHDAADIHKALSQMTAENRTAAMRELGLDADAVMAEMRQVADAALRAATPELGLDADALLAAIGDEAGAKAIADDIAAGKALPRLRHGTRAGLHGIPTIFINGKWVPRWKLGPDSVLAEILDAAGK